MTRYLLDTNHLSHALQVSSSLRERLLAARRRGSRLATCWPVLCELEAGLVQMVDSSRHRRMLTVVMHEVRVWPLDWTAVRNDGVVNGLAKDRGRSLSVVDTILAALAWEDSAVVLTADKDFTAFPEIRTENWLTGP
jgi:predicted nucleic acid-binding protein